MDDGIEVQEGVQLVDDAGYGRGAQRAQDGIGELWKPRLALLWGKGGVADVPLRSFSLRARTQSGRVKGRSGSRWASESLRSVCMAMSPSFWLRVSSE